MPNDVTHAVIRLQSVSKHYAGRRGVVHALRGGSLELHAGEVVALAGPSGSGKTTLLLIAGGLLRPDEGSVFWDGQEPYHLSAEARARLRGARTGFVFQQFHLIPYLSVLENVMAPGLVCPRSAGQAEAESLLDGLGLTHRIAHFPGELSTGERQRVALARAMFNRPTVLLADEPTANLDAENARHVTERLVRHAQENGAVLVATHEQDVLKRAHRVLFMKEGELQSQETVR